MTLGCIRQAVKLAIILLLLSDSAMADRGRTKKSPKPAVKKAAKPAKSRAKPTIDCDDILAQLSKINLDPKVFSAESLAPTATQNALVVVPQTQIKETDERSYALQNIVTSTHSETVIMDTALVTLPISLIDGNNPYQRNGIASSIGLTFSANDRALLPNATSEQRLVEKRTAVLADLSILSQQSLRGFPALPAPKNSLARSRPEIDVFSRSENRYGRRDIQLSNGREHRYFWYIPVGSTEPRPARVLDIHIHKEELTVAVEWLVPSQDTAKRVRFINFLRPEELPTISINDQKFNPQSAEEEFINSLSPNELLAQRLARQLGLGTYTYAAPENSPNSVVGPSIYNNVLSKMDRDLDKAKLNFMVMTFPKLFDYFTQNEKDAFDADKYSEYNLSDIFSRISLQALFKDFIHNDPTIEYVWLITEDGALQIAPHLRTGNNLKPQLLRQAHGRNIFAGGSMRVYRDGEIKLTYDANSYQDKSHRDPRNFNFRSTMNFSIDAFVATVFLTQTGRSVSNIDGRNVKAFDFSQDEELAGIFRNIFNTVETTKARNDVHVVENWNPDSNKVPLAYNEWRKKSGISMDSEQIKLQWAHYILSTDSNMSFEAIRLKFRKLASRFHSDRNPSPLATEILQELNVAKDAVERMKHVLKGKI